LEESTTTAFDRVGGPLALEKMCSGFIFILAENLDIVSTLLHTAEIQRPAFQHVLDPRGEVFFHEGCICAPFLLPSFQIDAYIKVSMSWPDMAFCFMPGASHHHKNDVGCTGTQFWPNNAYIIKGYLL
jgi:hypothetical protein